MKPTTRITPEQLERFTRNLKQLVEDAGLHGFVCSVVPHCSVEAQTATAIHHSISCVLCNFEAAKGLTDKVAERAIAAIDALGIEAMLAANPLVVN